jgi:hypothetical protein
MSRQNFERAKQILRSLIHGRDPATGEDLPSDAVVNRIEVNRALLIAFTATEEKAVRTARRAQLPTSVGRPWSAEEEESLSEEFKRGESVADIAKKHQRTIRAIEARLERLGLLMPDQRTASHYSSLDRPKGGKTPE